MLQLKVQHIKLGLELDHLVGQGYDGAAAMSIAKESARALSFRLWYHLQITFIVACMLSI